MNSEKNTQTQIIIQEIKTASAQKIKVAVTDLDGVLRGKYLHKDKFLSAVASGFGFCNVIFGWDSNDDCYDNSVYTGLHTGYPDANAKIDLNTYRKIPWENDLPFFLADFEDEHGNDLQVCPRRLLRKVLSSLDKEGYSGRCGMEFEWFNFKETPQTFADKNYAHPDPLTPGMFGYSLLRSALNQPFFDALMDEMNAFGIPIEGLHTETGPGVLEAAILYSDPLLAADRSVLFKTATKQIGYRFGILPSFMAKWNSKLPGCSGHIHQSLWNPSGTENLFHDPNDSLKMSSIFKSYLAGQLHCLPEIFPMFAPNVNSYKRLVDGFWAPSRLAWGVDNRTTSLRVINSSAKAIRVETRVPGSDVNPYLAIAASLASGLYGIKNNLQLKQAPILGSAYLEKTAIRHPVNLEQATSKMANSKIANELFGEAFVDHFTRTRSWEWKQFQDSVTDWELKRYFEIV